MTYMNTGGEKQTRRSYAFRISRDYPRIWEDRIDIIAMASILIALLSWGGAAYLEAIIPSLPSSNINMVPRALPTLFWGGGGIACLIAVAFWFSIKNQCIHLQDAPSLLSTPKFIRFVVYVMMLCGPYAYFYADLSLAVYNAPSSDSFGELFFISPDPWLSWVTLSIMMGILVFIATTQNYGFSQAIGGFIIALILYAALLLGCILVATAMGWSGGDTEVAIVMCVVPGTILVLGLIVPGQRNWVRLCFRIPALYAATFGVWIIPLFLFRIYRLSTYVPILWVLTLFAVVFLNGFLLTVLQRRLLR